MADKHLARQDPTDVLAQYGFPAGQVTSATGGQGGQAQNRKIWWGSADLTSVATANVSFQNPHSQGIVARVSYIVTGAAGTGTTDIGTSTGGTGDDDAFFNGGTLTAGAHRRFTHYGTVAASAVAGNVDLGELVIGASGEANDSIVAKITDTATSTMGAYYLRVEYDVIDVG
jgi:hypothetical protein